MPKLKLLLLLSFKHTKNFLKFVFFFALGLDFAIALDIDMAMAIALCLCSPTLSCERPQWLWLWLKLCSFFKLDKTQFQIKGGRLVPRRNIFYVSGKRYK